MGDTMNNNPEYDKLLDNIKQISALSNKDNSVFYDFYKRDNVMKTKISILENTGISKTDLVTGEFDITDKFQSFITPILDEFVKDNEIAKNDFVDANSDNLVTYRAITYNNDQLSVDGLLFDDMFFIQNYIDEKKANSIDKTKVYTLTNKGMLSTYVLITIITILSIIIGLLVYFE